MIKGYIFDYGGTLDTEGHHWGKVLWHSYQRQHVPVTEEQFREAYVYGERTLGNVPIIKPDYTFYKTLDTKLRLEMEYICSAGFWDADEDELNRMHKAVLDDVYSDVKKVTDHSRDVLEKLNANYPMVLVSNFYGNVGVVLKEFKLDHLFLAIVESAVVGIRKPDPRIYKLGVEKLGMQPEEVAVVGDSFYKDIQPANKIGCKTIWFKGEGWTDKVYDETLPDRIITDIAQILQ
ncbi:HAD family hydrolase [Segatella paludivivens]|uniref:HAD family hydrolase n=1 Tax=Segatella paludivivens TaxID=185294 RepID=UPI00037424BC|nr:HAD family hydrolase [Segatella paludivivens]